MNSGYELAQTWLSFVAIVVIYSFILRRQAAESCRAELRRIRDEFFDFMWQNGKDFSDVEYVESRQQINSMLRLTTMIGPVSFIVMMFRFMPVVASRTVKAEREPSELKIHARKVSTQAIHCLVKYIFMTGILGLVLHSIFFIFEAWKRVGIVKGWAVERTWNRVGVVKGWAVDRTWEIVDFAARVPQPVLPRQKSVFG